ncbi:MAG: hypothetical protein JXB88_10055 [Spirochaetales bacterium]|nr:hypothetical protein [Spirochaetales bacterium]
MVPYEYGETKHETTQVAPIQLFEEEKSTFILLPPERFEVPVWKVITVHRDRFFSFEGKYYAMSYIL